MRAKLILEMEIDDLSAVQECLTDGDYPDEVITLSEAIRFDWNNDPDIFLDSNDLVLKEVHINAG